MADVGSTAPAFTLVDTNREKKSLSDFAGKKTVIAFFPAAFTGVCTNEMCAFRDSMAELNGLDASVVGISVDGPFTNAEFKAKNNLEFPILCDYTHEVVKSYGVVLQNFAGLEGYNVAQRSIFVLDQAGVIRHKWVAENPGIEPDYAAIKAEIAKL
jgi:glutaredoxin-dependent peroxiredoxin